jgi:superfamily I DNA/RNA helicase
VKLTEEQDQIINAAASRQSLMINAGAGCGKSSTLARAGATVKVPALSLTFAMTNTADLRSLLGPSWTVKSFNGLGHMAWARSPQCRATSVTIDEKKLGKLVTQVSKEFKTQLLDGQWGLVRKLVTKAMTEGLVPGDQSSARLRADTPDEWADMAEDLGVPTGDTAMMAELGREVLVRSIKLAKEGILSYDDQVYCSVLLGGKFPQFPLVAVDEDQDLSPLQIAMVSAVARPGGRLWCVGDRAQAIYHWRGAAGDAEQQLRLLKPQSEWLDLPLMTSFRCPHRVAERQQEHVPGFRAAHGNPMGAVCNHVMKLIPDDYWCWNDIKAYASLQERTGLELAVLCRNNAPLVAMAFKLLRQGVGVQMLGRDIGAQAAQLAKRVCPDDSSNATQVREAIQQYQSDETSKLLANGHEEKVEALQDRCGVLLAVLDSGKPETAGGLRLLLSKLFEPKPGGSSLVTLSSIHRAKGREWDLVTLLDPWRGAKRRDGQSDISWTQELNARYVAETRTRHTLVLANSEDFR